MDGTRSPLAKQSFSPAAVEAKEHARKDAPEEPHQWAFTDMQREAYFDSSWPVALVFGLIGTFTLAITPAGQEFSNEILSLPRLMHNACPAAPARPQVLVVTSDRHDQYTARVAVTPRGYHVLIAETASAAQKALQTDPNGIGVVLVDMRLKSAAHVLGLARSLTPAARVIPLRANHSTTDISILLIDAI